MSHEQVASSGTNRVGKKYTSLQMACLCWLKVVFSVLFLIVFFFNSIHPAAQLECYFIHQILTRLKSQMRFLPPSLVDCWYTSPRESLH